MNRIKVWVFTLLVVIAGAVALHQHSAGLRAAATANLDAVLAGAAAQVSSSTRNIAREANAAAAFTARDDKLVTALNAKEAPAAKARRPKGAPDELDVEEAALREAARAALSAVEKALGLVLPGTTVVTAGNREWLAKKGSPSPAEGEAMAFLRSAIDGKVRRGYVRLSSKLWYAAASPAGSGAGLMVLVPFDDAWAKEIASAAGVDVTLSVPDVKPVSTDRGPDAAAVAGWDRGAGAADVGRFGRADVAIGPLKVPRMPLVFGGAPAARARAVAVEGVKKGYVVLSAPASAALGALVRTEWLSVAGLALVLAVGIVLGFTVRESEGPPLIPEKLVAVAARIEKGDFAARAPAFAGKLGTLSAALNRAAEVAGPAAAAASARPAAASEPAPKPAAPALGGGPFEAAARPVAAPAQAAQVLDEDAHWQEIFEEFLRTRAQCGEASEGLTYEKFKLKLEGNKSQLISKYGCKTVRFQVYVKEGKAALKATPVK